MKRTLVIAGLLAVAAVAQTTYDIGGISFTDNELEAYQSAVVTQANELRRFKDKAEDALRFFDLLDPALFNATEKGKILEARTVIRLAAKRQIDSIGSTPVTPITVKRDLLEQAVANEEEGAQAALDAFNAEHPE